MQCIKFKWALALALFCLPGVGFTQQQAPVATGETIRVDKKNYSEALNWMVWKDQVKPTDQKLYEEKILTIINKIKQNPNFLRVLTFFESSTSTYYFLYPFSNADDWHKIYAGWSEEASRNETRKHLINYSIYLTQSSPELSQFPTSGKISLADPNYVHMEHFEVLPDAEDKFIALLNEWKTQTHAKAPDCGWYVHKTLISENLPSYVMLWGDCLKNQENILQLDRFLLEKHAYGTIVKRVVLEDKIYVSKLSTAPLELSSK